MSDNEKDSLMDCLFSGQDMKLRNIKFFRGNADLIDEGDFRDQVHRALVQSRTKLSPGSNEAPKSTRAKVDVREVVANI